MGSDDVMSLWIAGLLVFVRPLTLLTEIEDSENGFVSVFRPKEKRCLVTSCTKS